MLSGDLSQRRQYSSGGGEILSLEALLESFLLVTYLQILPREGSIYALSELKVRVFLAGKRWNFGRFAVSSLPLLPSPHYLCTTSHHVIARAAPNSVKEGGGGGGGGGSSEELHA